MGLGAAAFGAKAGVSGILAGAAYGAGSGAVVGGVSGGLNSFLNDEVSFQSGLGMGALAGGISGGISGGIIGGIDASNKDLNIWTAREKADVYYSPVGNNFGDISKGCSIYCLEEASKSYGLKNFDFNDWASLYGKKLGVHPSELENLIQKSSIFGSERLVVNTYSGDVSQIAEAFKANKRVIAGFAARANESGHAVLVNKVKIWPSGKYRVWFSQTSPVRISPYSSNNLFKDFYSIGFWTFYKK